MYLYLMFMIIPPTVFIISVRDNDSNKREFMYNGIKESLSNLISSIPVTVEERIKDTL